MNTEIDRRGIELDLLWARYGIEPEFRDARGEIRATSRKTQEVLLGAMGVQAGNETEVRNALRELDRLEGCRALAPVYVVADSKDPSSVIVTLPSGTGGFSWCIELEDGTKLRGECIFSDLERADETQTALGRERRRLVLARNIPHGYHQLFVDPGRHHAALIVTPGTCWLPKITHGVRLWGVSLQLYLMRSADNWGIGDYGDLRRLIDLLLARGADVVGLNPLHAMFLDDPEQASPYSPANRLLLNVLNIDVTSVPELADCKQARELIASAEFQSDLEGCRQAAHVQYSKVAKLKVSVLTLLFASFRAGRGSLRWEAFEAFQRYGGKPLIRGCVFQALREHFAPQASCGADWHLWPEEYRNPESRAVASFAQDHEERVCFHLWLQFIAENQLAAAGAAATSMAVGLYRDLAVGSSSSGAETWANPTAVIADVQVGAPPDIYNPMGQGWGLPPFNPVALRAEAYRSFIELLRANMRHAGGLRIDHVMALKQLYWVPAGMSPANGAYVRYPLEDLVGILALESHRNQCLIVGEDLGTVPEGFRERMARANILSYRVLLFERNEAGFMAPHRYPRLGLAVTGSHDLPTLRGWWAASDLELKEKLNLFPQPEDAERARQERARDRSDLCAALTEAGLLEGHEMGFEELIRGANAYLARSACGLAMVQMDDIAAEQTPVNVPTTSLEYPNWRRRLSLAVEQMEREPRFVELCEIFRRERK